MVKFENPGPENVPAYLYFLRRAQLGEHGGHALALRIPIGPESSAGRRTSDEAGPVGCDKP